MTLANFCRDPPNFCPQLTLKAENARSYIYIFIQFFIDLAGAEVPSTQRSKSAVERVIASLEKDLARRNLTLGAPIYIQVTKVPAELTVFVRTPGGDFRTFRTYPICAFSGGLGPKKREGDGKSPEGFYQTTAD